MAKKFDDMSELQQDVVLLAAAGKLTDDIMQEYLLTETDMDKELSALAAALGVGVSKFREQTLAAIVEAAHQRGWIK
jgi:hypothetical protein